MAKGFGGARSKRSLKDLPPHLQRTALWVTGGCALAACIGLVVASVWIVNVLSFLSVARSAEAGVLDVEFRRSRNADGHTSTTYRPTFRFTDGEGAEHTVTPSSSKSWWNYRKGQTIEVLYDPAKPDGARPSDTMSTWFAPGLIGLISLGFAGVGVPGFFSVRRQIRMSRQTNTSDDLLAPSSSA